MTGWLLAYALYAWLWPALPTPCPVPPLDLVVLATCAATGQRAQGGRLAFGFCLLDALLATPAPWLRWLLRAALVGMRVDPLPPRLALVAVCTLLALWQLSIPMRFDPVQLTLAAVLAWHCLPDRTRRRERWGWHERSS